MGKREVGIFVTGFKFPEGPAVDRNGHLFLVDMATGDISRVSPEGRAEIFFNTGGIPNGAKFHENGDLYVADRKCGIIAISPQKAVRVIADRYHEEKFNGPNDLVFDSQGNLYFTDPEGSSAEEPYGRLYRISSSGEINCLASGLAYPNGLVLSHDERCLFVAITRKNRILRYILDPPPFRSYIFSQLSGGWGPDGMAFDAMGNLYVAHYGGGAVLLLNPKGELLERIPLEGMHPTNVAFGDRDRRALFVTEAETGSVYRFKTEHPGLPLFGDGYLR